MDELEAAIKRACDDAGPDIKAAVAASIAICRERHEGLLKRIREANRRYGIGYADRVLVRDLPPDLQALNEQYTYVERRIREIEDVQSRVVVRPDGKTIILPRGHSFGGFSEDGKVISSTTTVVVHHEEPDPDPRKDVAAVSAGRRAVRLRCQVRQRRGSSGRPRGGGRRLASTSSSDDPDEPGPPLWRHPKYGRVNRLNAAFVDHEAVVE